MISQYDNALEQKWQPVLEGISDEYSRKVTATLLENQAKATISERVDEADSPTQVGHLGTFQKFAFPLIRRVYPNLIANKIVGVQPMQGPVSQVFYLGHSRVFNGGTPQNVYGKYNLTYRGLQAEPQFNSTAASAASLVTGSFSGTATGMFSRSGDLNLQESLGFQSPTGTMGGKIASWPLASQYMGAWSVSAGEILSGGLIPELTISIEQQPIAAVTRKMRALWTLEAAQDLKAYHNLDLESELTTLLSQEMALEIDRELIEDLRMIAYNFSTAVGGWAYTAFDLNNSNNLPTLGRTLTQAGTTTETIAPTSYTFNQASMGTLAGAGGGDPESNVILVNMAPDALGANVLSPRHLGHVYANLLAVVNFAAQDIYKSTLRGPGSFILTSPLVAAMLESAAKLEGGIRAEDSPTNFKGNGIEFKGKFMGRYDLMIDPLFPDDEIIVGYKGPNSMDAGLIYAPYIPMQQIPTITDPQTFQPRKGILTRYGKACITPGHRFYRVIRLLNAGGTMLPAAFARKILTTS